MPTDLFVDKWDGIPGSNRVLLIVHGLGEHGGRYQHLPQNLKGQFERFYAVDQFGHGRSPGVRGDAPSFSTFVDDLKETIFKTAAENTGKRLYLLAHSFGGLVALKLLLSERVLPLAGAIISAPLLGIALKVPAYKRILGEILGKTLPRVQLGNEVDATVLSHDPQVAKDYLADRLVHQKITPRMYLGMCEAMAWVNSQTAPLPCPALFLIPGQDKVVDSHVTLEFFKDLKYRDKSLCQYPEMYHEVLNETDKEKVFDDIKAWLINK